MKNTIKVLGIAVIITAIALNALLLTGCPSPDSGNNKTLDSIAVTTLPTKTEYAIGEDFKSAGMVVTATYSDGSTAEVTDYTTDISGYDKTTAGTKTITVTYQGKTAEFTVKVIDRVATPTANPAVGAIASGTEITLSTITEGAEIWYTTDNSTPSKNGATSTKYTDKIAISSPTTIKAIAVKDGMSDSSLLTAVYTLLFTSAPVLTLEPENAKIIYTWTASDPAADSYDVYWKQGDSLTADVVKTGTKNHRCGKRGNNNRPDQRHGI